ncbi:MAG: hypothetical protein JWQ21_1478 [Herminiimonas sp.]|nr:hypothetical protein [Herminiimonas sp.]
MTNVNGKVTIELLEAFSAAWNRHDIDALMSFMTNDCVFEAAAGPEACGKRFEGQEAVRAAFALAWSAFPNAQWERSSHFICGDRGVSQWTYTGTRADGMRIEANGCDIFTFRDGKIAVKSAYRKDRPLIGMPKA